MEEGDHERVCVLNPQILSRSRGLTQGHFPKTYWVHGNWTAWVVGLMGSFCLLAPKIFVPLWYGKEAFSMPFLGGAYMWFFGFYALFFMYILAFRIPSAIERDKDTITLHFVLRKLQVPIKDIEEIRIVRKWMVKDSARLAARAAPSVFNSCIPKSVQYDEVNVSKHSAKRACPFCCCDPPDSDTRFYWGAPGMWGREVCIVSMRDSICGNYAFDLKDGDGFIKDNKADYSNMGASPQLVPTRIGAPVLPEDAGLTAPGAFSPMVACTSSPTPGLVSPLEAFESGNWGPSTPEKNSRPNSKDLAGDRILSDLERIHESWETDSQEENKENKDTKFSEDRV